MVQPVKSSPSVDDILNKLMPLEVRQQSAPKFTTKAMSIQVPIHYLADPTERQAKAVMAAMTLCGRSIEVSPIKWQTWVLTWSCLVFPELVSIIKDAAMNAEYNLVPFEIDFVDSCVDAILAQGSQETAGEKFLGIPATLPDATNIPFTGALAGSAAIEGLYAYYAMIVFIMGKSLSSETVSAIATKRPDALIRKRQMGRSEYILKGDGRIAQDNYGRVQGGWVRSTVPRIIIVKHLAALYASNNRPETLDPVVINMDMLRNSGQTYIFYVYELLVACDWCLAIPSLAASYRHFSRMVNVLTQEPAYVQPFFKMMMQDSTKEFRRREVEVLVGVAIFYAAQTRATLKNYRISPEVRPVILQFIKLAADRGIAFSEIPDQATIEVSAV